MGLDMSIYASRKNGESVAIATFRKHKDLHRFIEGKWREKNPLKEEEFNCIPFRLKKPLCKEIMKLSKKGTMPKGEDGFFFGETIKEDTKETVEAMKRALELIKEGYRIYYDSWW